MTDYITGTPEQLHAGAVSFHFCVDDIWYGILMDLTAKLAQADLVRDAYNGRSTIIFELSGAEVPSNAAATGSDNVPEAINFNRGL